MQFRRGIPATATLVFEATAARAGGVAGDRLWGGRVFDLAGNRSPVKSFADAVTAVFGLQNREVVDNLLFLRGFSRFWQTPAGIREAGPLKHGKAGLEANRRRRIRVFEKRPQIRQSHHSELVDLVAERLGVVPAGLADGGSELPLVTKPVVDGGAMDAGGLGSGGNGGSLSQGHDHLRLNRRQCRR